MAKRIGDHMETSHNPIKFINSSTPTKLERPDPNGRIHVTFDQATDEMKESKTEEFDTVLFAIGRYAVTEKVNCANAGVTVEKNGKIKCNNEQTNTDNIYAVGDVIHGRLELTPVAIKAGALLSYRLFDG